MDAQTWALITGPTGGMVVLAIVCWKLYSLVIDLTGKMDRLNEVIVGLVRDATKADSDAAAAARELAASVRAAARIN